MAPVPFEPDEPDDPADQDVFDEPAVLELPVLLLPQPPHPAKVSIKS
jgi:hypothetical protein